MTALAYALQLLAAIPQLFAAGRDIKELYDSGMSKLKEMQEQGRDPTTAEWDELNARIDTLRSELHSGTTRQVRQPGEAPLPHELAQTRYGPKATPEDVAEQRPRRQEPARPNREEAARASRETPNRGETSATRREGTGHGLRATENTDGDKK